jgi:hypothetical protein
MKKILDYENILYSFFNQKHIISDTNIKELLYDTDAFIFGGCLRDIISKDFENVNVIDIMCLSKSFDIIMNRLEDLGYSKKCITNIYFDNGLRKELDFYVFSFKKDYFKEIQLILCYPPFQFIREDSFNEKKSFKFLCEKLSSVDLSTSGLIFNPEYGFYESIKGALQDCLNKRFRILGKNEMFHENRTEQRKNKLIKNGWKCIDF